METDRKYFFEGLFIIGLSIAVAFFFVWLQSSGRSDDVLYRIHFTDSVSGLAQGDAVKFHGVDIGTVKTIALDAADPRRVQVDVRLRRDAPIKTDTHATLKLKGITGIVFIELDGGAPASPRLAEVTPNGRVPEIVSEKGSLSAIMDTLPKILREVFQHRGPDQEGRERRRGCHRQAQEQSPGRVRIAEGDGPVHGRARDLRRRQAQGGAYAIAPSPCYAARGCAASSWARDCAIGMPTSLSASSRRGRLRRRGGRHRRGRLGQHRAAARARYARARCRPR